MCNFFDVIIIGAGHAGCEAALAAARLGVRTALFTLSLDQIANMPCNPAIGGTAKGQIVAEIDALGGEMGRAADATALQSRLLNTGKGAAVQSLRMQNDRAAYHLYMKSVLEKQENLSVIQDEVAEIVVDSGKVTGVRARLWGFCAAKCVVIATGVYLRGRIHVGGENWAGGPDGSLPANELSESLVHLGVRLRKFKTGTPPRAARNSIDFTAMERQDGDLPGQAYAFDNDTGILKNTPCFLTYTNAETHRIIREHLRESAMFGGQITGTGPRYCPSIEDKIFRFADKERHQLFVEPCGENTEEFYLQGLSTSLPLAVQYEFLRTIKGLEHLEIMRPAYAIEYDCIDPTQLGRDLRFKNIAGLYGAGQFNGTSGYEEAAAQGIIAGINAALSVKGQPAFTLTRDSSYIGVLIDDLILKGCDEPYRMMTGRAEYRLSIRQDNAADRLCERSLNIGLLPKTRYDFYKTRKTICNELLNYLKQTVIKPTVELNNMIVLRGTSVINHGTTCEELLKRPQIRFADLLPFFKNLPEMNLSEYQKSLVTAQTETLIKYAGYIKQQEEQIARERSLEEKPIPIGIDYNKIGGLRLEAREKLQRMRPETVGQAGRVSGVNPADITVLLVWLSAGDLS